MFFNQPALDPCLSALLFTGYEILVMHFAHQIFGYQVDALYTFRGLENYLKQLPAAKGHVATGVNLAFGFPLGSARVAAIYWAWSFYYPDRKCAMFAS